MQCLHVCRGNQILHAPHTRAHVRTRSMAYLGGVPLRRVPSGRWVATRMLGRVARRVLRGWVPCHNAANGGYDSEHSRTVGLSVPDFGEQQDSDRPSMRGACPMHASNGRAGSCRPRHSRACIEHACMHTYIPKVPRVWWPLGSAERPISCSLSSCTLTAQPPCAS